jgi:membrane fusion protein (multidrug efflux system)
LSPRQWLARQGFRGIFLAVTALLLASAVLLRAGRDEPAPSVAAGSDVAAPLVDVLSVTSQPLKRVARISGVVEPRRRVQLISETTGRVIALGAEELDAVEADQLLLQVDPLLAEVAVERARAAVARTESQLALADDDRERFESLVGRDAASTQRRDQAVNAWRVASANLREARANLAEARDGLAKKTIRAPFTGVLQTFSVELGESLRMGDALAELLDLETARLEIGVTDREVVALGAGETVEIAIEAYPGEAFSGTILRVGAAADTTSKKFPVEIELENPERRLLPGMIARATLSLGATEPLRAVPRDVALDQFGVDFVYVVEEAEGGFVARKRRVSLRNIPFRPTQVELVSGVADGERIAASGMRALRDGARVRVRSEKPVAKRDEGADAS